MELEVVIGEREREREKVCGFVCCQLVMVSRVDMCWMRGVRPLIGGVLLPLCVENLGLVITLVVQLETEIVLHFGLMSGYVV